VCKKGRWLFEYVTDFEGDKYNSAVAMATEEAKELTDTGFEYVCTHQDLLLFRKRKW